LGGSPCTFIELGWKITNYFKEDKLDHIFKKVHELLERRGLKEKNNRESNRWSFWGIRAGLNYKIEIDMMNERGAFGRADNQNKGGSKIGF